MTRRMMLSTPWAKSFITRTIGERRRSSRESPSWDNSDIDTHRLDPSLEGDVHGQALKHEGRHLLLELLDRDALVGRDAKNDAHRKLTFEQGGFLSSGSSPPREPSILLVEDACP